LESIIVLTDIHLRSDYVVGFLDAQIKTLLKLVNDKRPNAVVINGDIFHKRSPRATELLAFKSLLDNLKAKRIIVNRGNHDTVSKSDTTDTVLDLFQNEKVKVVKGAEIVNICGVDFLFSPHYESEELILRDLKQYPNLPVFGHWGYAGCVAVRGRAYESLITKQHIKDRYCFMGHLHTPIESGKSYVLGTQYSISFGEANSDKYLHEILIHDRTIKQINKKVINFGIRHIRGSYEEIEELLKKFSPNQFFLLVRVEVDKFKVAVESKLYDQFTSKYSVNHLEFAVKTEASLADENNLVTVRDMTGKQIDDLVKEYVLLKPESYTTDLLLEYYEKEIRPL
jgi:DNA repair exonuclease SbcCD nuclease subunit